jgi:ribonuclease P protein subunit RPR2
MKQSKQLPECNVPSQQWNHLYQAAQFSLFKHVQNGQQSMNESAISNYYTHVSVNVAKKSLLKIEPHLKRTVCKGCEGLLLPGLTAQVRILKKPASVIQWRCMRCQTWKKFPSIRHYEAWFENATFKYPEIEAQKHGQKISRDCIVMMNAVNDLGFEKKSVNNVRNEMAEHMVIDSDARSLNIVRTK